MKLLHCRNCHDVTKLRREVTFCQCGLSSGWYHPDGLHASFRGAQAVLLGIANPDLREALELNDLYPMGADAQGGEGWQLLAFVIPENSPRTTRLKTPGKEES